MERYISIAQKYIELIPNDPNPYNSCAELLMKMGKCEKSVKLIQASDLSQEIKDNANRGFLYNIMRHMSPSGRKIWRPQKPNLKNSIKLLKPSIIHYK